MNIIKIGNIVLVLILLIRKNFVNDLNEIRVSHEVFKTFQMQPHAAHIGGKNVIGV